MAAVAALVLVALVVLFFVWLWQSGYFIKKKYVDKLQGPPALPLVGNAHMLEHGTAFYNQVLGYCETYYDAGIFRLWLGMEPLIAVFRANTIQVLFNSSRHMEKSDLYRFLHPWLGTGLLTSTGQKWRERRRLITPSFHFKILHDFLDVFNEQSKVMVAKLEGKVDKGEFDIFQDVTLCALDIICETAMGRHVSAQKNSESEYVKAIYSLSELVHIRQKAPWIWTDFMYGLIGDKKKHDEYLDILHRFTLKVIKERHQELQDYFKNNPGKLLVGEEAKDDPDLGFRKKKRLAFLDMLLSAAEDAKLSFDDIREEVDTFMFEGHDTTAAAVNFALHLIGSHPDVQERLHEELDQVFGNSDRPVTPEDLKDLKYLECVIKESLRLFPSVPMFARILSEECTIGGYTLPKGLNVTVVTSAVHRDPEFFPDPLRFDPERFFPENTAGRHPFAFIPFSAGQRNCIGQRFAMNEEKVMLSSILRNFHVKATRKTEELNPTEEIILRPQNGIWVKLSKRTT